MDLGFDPGCLPANEVHDEADLMQWMQLRELADVQARARQMNAPEHHPDFDGEHCVDCDTPIPERRLLLHKVRCVDCQGMLEAQQRRR